MPKQKSDVVQLTQELVKRQSYREGNLNEKKVTNFLYRYLKTNFPFLTVRKQYVAKNRWNIFAYDQFPTKLLVVDHTDTVEPVSSWSFNPLEPAILDSKLSGLGSSDTKGSIAAFLAALQEAGETKGLALLFYVDEEYDFLGMKQFVNSKESKNIFPKYIYSLDGDDLRLGLGCRGLIELKVTLVGKTGHSAKGNGVNVNSIFLQIIQEVENLLGLYSDPYLGKTTLNVARINSGCLTGNNQFSTQGNRIPDYLESVVELRKASAACTVTVLKKIIEKISKKNKAKCSINITQDWQSFVSSKKDVAPVIDVLEKELSAIRFLDPNVFGYLDVAQLRSRYPKSVIFSCGSGVPGQAHAAEEYVEIENLQKAVRINIALLKKLQISK